jgi:arylsulfatase A-like enzyme
LGLHTFIPDNKKNVILFLSRTSKSSMSLLKASLTALIIPLIAGFASIDKNNSESEHAEQNKPNIILLFADDLGYGDLGCFGHPYAKTPNLDQLAEQGTRFMKFNVTGKTCHPSRVGLLTSRVPSSYPISTDTYGFNQAKDGYVDRITVMELMKGAGYTTGHFGKWHIGPDSEIAPGIYGLDDYQVLGGGGKDEFGRDQKIYNAAIAFIEENKDKPFYLNVMGRVTHNPVEPRPDLIELAGFGTLNGDGQLVVEAFVNRQDFIGSQIQKSFDVVESANDPANVEAALAAGIIGDISYSMANYLTEVYFLDKFIGQLLAKLDELGIADNTIVMFASDQGPAPTQFIPDEKQKINLVGYSGGLRGQKHDEHEGGIRVPCIMRWPGKIPAGKVNTESTWSSLDWLPTLCQVADIPIDLSKFHGEEVLDIWLGSDRSRSRPLYWTQAMKIIDEEGEWRVYFGDGDPPPVEELYNLSSDLMETEDLKDARKDKADEFQAMWVKWLENYEYEKDSSSVKSPETMISKESVLPVYPNPVESYLQIDINAGKFCQIHIFDSGGRLVMAQTVSENIVDVSHLGRGIYLVHITTEQGKVYQQKVFKQ